MKKTIILSTLLLVTALLISGCSQTSPIRTTTQATNNQPTQNPPTPAPSGQLPSAQEKETFNIYIQNFAFDPPSLTVKAGTTVTWTNQGSAPHQIASDPHPTHTDLPGLQSAVLSTSQSYSFTFTKKGIWGYHCHLHPAMTGTIIVE